jgi:homoserine kinase
MKSPCRPGSIHSDIFTRSNEGASRSQYVNRLSCLFCVRLLPVKPGRLQWRRAQPEPRGQEPNHQMQNVTVRVPASTSNLGPGFDCLGIALRLYNNVTISRRRGWPLPAMVRAAAVTFFQRTRCKPFPFSCAIAGDIPACRGLGSSASVRLGVITGLNEMAGRPLQRQQIFEICSKQEGHPDNAAPALYGGFNVVRDGQRQTFTVSAQLHFVLLVPDFEIATEVARRVLPSRVDRLHAVENCRNACAVTAAFASREYEKLRGAFVDHLHQPFRKKLIPFLDDVIAAAESAGALGGFLSGSGSTVCAVTLRSPDKLSRAMLAAADSEGARTIITAADNRGARVLTIANRKSIRSPIRPSSFDIRHFPHGSSR